jgi:hypothetical protein
VSRARTLLGLLIAGAILAVLSPALYYYGTTWIRGPVMVEVEELFPIGNKGTLEAKLAFPDGEVHRVLNRDQTLLFWKFDSEGVDNELSTARKADRKVEAWFSGLYMPLFGNSSIFNHVNVLAVEPTLPPGAAPAALYTTLLLAFLLWLRRLFRRIGEKARNLTGGADASASQESSPPPSAD